MVPDTVSNELNYYIPEEDFEKLTRGMSNTVKNEVIALEMKKWGGSCYGMVRVAAIRYLDKIKAATNGYFARAFGRKCDI